MQEIRVLWTAWKGENDMLKSDTLNIVLIILLVHHIVSLLLYWTQLIQIYAKRDNVVLKITILFVTSDSNLYSSIDQIIDLVLESQLKNKDDLLYGTSNTKNDILKWTFHIIHHVHEYQEFLGT